MPRGCAPASIRDRARLRGPAPVVRSAPGSDVGRPRPQREALGTALNCERGSAPIVPLGLAVLTLLGVGGEAVPSSAAWTMRRARPCVGRSSSSSSLSAAADQWGSGVRGTRWPASSRVRRPSGGCGAWSHSPRSVALLRLRSPVRSRWVRVGIVAESHGDPLALLELRRGSAATSASRARQASM